MLYMAYLDHMTEMQTSAPCDHGWRQRILTIVRGNTLFSGPATAYSPTKVLCDARRASSDWHSAVYGPVSSHDFIAHIASLKNKTLGNPQQSVGRQQKTS